MLLISWSDNMSTEQVYIFQNRYCKPLLIKGLQSYGPSNFEDDPIVRESNQSRLCVVFKTRGAINFGGKFYCGNLNITYVIKPQKVGVPWHPPHTILCPFVKLKSLWTHGGRQSQICIVAMIISELHLFTS